MGARLLEVGKQNADFFGWDYVRGVDAAFSTRGYCSSQLRRYFNVFSESEFKQDNRAWMTS